MNKLESLFRNRLTRAEFEELGNLYDLLREISIDYAETYAKDCIESLCGGKCTITSGKITHTSSDNTLKIIADSPKHE